ncbi:carnitine dehydratase [Rhodovulum viride]|uniref:Carnitine dehydratase n=1 Tax=Rhodovulum viride TaxID=1231134 RepID=A0ABX9DIH4_9RHOB|nr:CaiB/BaiF CoA-transferase family protein [Rhodovulum viride]RAP41196.1 carnitine dehydratase [Rhodovulum viride]
MPYRPCPEPAAAATTREGPLTGLRVVEMTGLGPAPYAAMILADLGAQVIRIDRPGGYPAPDPALDPAAAGRAAVTYRSRPHVRVDLKTDAGRGLVLRLVTEADALIEGFRPGTMERLGLGPEPCLAANPALAYVRMTGWGQNGPMAGMAGHDMNFTGLSGALSLFGQDGRVPKGMPPLMGDMGGGALFAVVGCLAAVMNAWRCGEGQVVDASILDGSASLYAMVSGMAALGLHDAPPGGNMLDGGRHCYRTYVCADGGAVVVAAIEPAFRKVLLDRLGLADDPQFLSGRAEDEADCTARLEAIFASRPRDHWAALFDGSDGCVTPVLDLAEAPGSAQARARGLFETVDGVVQPAPAPRFGRTPGRIALGPESASRPAPRALCDWGLTEAEIDALIGAGVLSDAD